MFRKIENILKKFVNNLYILKFREIEEKYRKIVKTFNEF